MSTAQQIIEDFNTFGIALEDNKIVEKCMELCSQHGVDGEGIAACWLAFAGVHGYDTLTLDSLDHYEREELAKKKKTSKKSENYALIDNAEVEGVEDDLLVAYGGTPTPKQSCNKRQLTPDTNIAKRHVGPARSISAQFSPASLSPSVATPSRKYSTRNNAGDVVSMFGNLKDATWKASEAVAPEVRLMAMGGDEPLTHAYKHMFEKIRDAADVLDDAIMNLADQMMKQLNVEEYSDYDVTSNESLCTVGRVCCDSVGRLNAASVLLEGCRSVSGGKALPLDLSHLQEYSLFPGQVVAVRGLNSTGAKILAQELVPGKILPLPDSPITIDKASGPIQMVVASGPFTTTENLLYEPLTDLLEAVRQNPPHILALLGPFLDASHPLVLNNQLTETFDAIVARCHRIITSALEGLNIQVILVASSRDICSPLVYPTPPSSVGGSLLCVSDPVMFDVEGVVIALTATDILFHLGKEEISYPPQGSDRLGRLARHILGQQSLYPLYPPLEGVCMDQEQVEQHARLPCTPHLLVLPSDLRYFAREIEGCVVVNPERLAKGLVGGTFARIELHSPAQSKGSMADHTNVHIVKV